MTPSTERPASGPTDGGGRRRPSTRATMLGVLLVALVLAGVVSFYASGSPDGLTKVSQDQGFADSEKDHATGEGPFAGYASSFISNDRLSGGVAGVVGVVVVLAIGSGVALVLRRRRGHGASGPSGGGSAPAGGTGPDDDRQDAPRVGSGA